MFTIKAAFRKLQAYSCGWKKARKDFPGEKEKWADLGNFAKAERLKLHRDAGVLVALNYVLP